VTGLAYNWHRHYDATTGRHLTPDPIGFVDGPGVYAYVSNSPVMKVDPRGLARIPDGPMTSIQRNNVIQQCTVTPICTTSDWAIKFREGGTYIIGTICVIMDQSDI
jgi:uncharacterized protein RhaS with RHS repeats